MKKVSGTLKLDLAQFRELEAFAKFGSDLDKETQKQLNRGSALMELLKQKQYSPVSTEKQVALIYAGTKGYLDDIAKDRLNEFEEKFYDFLDASCSDLLSSIKASGELDEKTEDNLKTKINDFIKGF
jgi:F-type H+-transporting ATPase subunit alpha